MKTIKTITCHDCYNYGASLQAYALMKYLLYKKNKIEIINYKPNYQYPRQLNYFEEGTRSYKLIEKYNFLRYIFILKRIIWKLFSKEPINKNARELFDKFTRDNLILTETKYTTSTELKNNPPVADIFIAGSDQIWNTKRPTGKDSAFYLDFVVDNSKKVSYAASFSTKHIYNNYESFVKEKLKCFDYISVREKTGLKILHELNILGGVQVLDPVFLLSKKQWEQLIVKTHSEKYLLVYDIYCTFGETSILPEIAKRVAKQNSLKIWSINTTTTIDYADKTIFGGPVEFLELIKSAEFVVSNSFHGTAFSVIFNKDFYTIGLPNKYDNESRITDFLDSIDLQNRYVTNNIEIDDICSIDYSNVNRILFDHIHNSELFLKESLS